MAESAGQGACLRSRLDARQLDLALRRLEGLGSPPVVVTGILELTSPIGLESAGRQTALDEAARLIALDPAMTAKVLSLANASQPGRFRAVSEAVLRLGADPIRSAALSAGFTEGPDAAGLPTAAFLRHCLAVASGAAMLARLANLPVPEEEAFTAGLLHDVGKLVLAQIAPKSYARALDAARRRGGSLADVERDVLGVDHLVAGRRLARRWHLPGTYADVIWLHHQPPGAVPPTVADAKLIGIVALADAIARKARIGLSGNGQADPPPEELAAELGIPAGEVSRVAETLVHRVERHARAMRLDQAESEAILHDALSGAQAELCRLNDRLRRRAETLSARARALGRFAEFAAALEPDAEVADVLLQAAEVFAAADDTDEAGAGPVICYSLDAESRTMLAVRHVAGRSPEWRTFEPAVPAAAADVCRGWADVDDCVHYPLASAGRRLGGVLCPAGQADEGREALAAALGMVLGMAQQRCRAATLSEDLAGASRNAAARHDAAVEARTLAAVEDLATGAAHELNNPLAVMSGRAQMMRDKARSQRQRDTWQTIVDQSQRISDLISGLMAYAQPPEPAPSRIDPAELLGAAAESFHSSDHPQAKVSEVDIETGEDVPAIWADRDQMHDVIVELIANAATAAVTVPRVRLAAEADDLARAVVLSVTDDGAGMDERTARKACTPFFSSQPAGRRPGLGLAKARRLVERNGGTLRIDSEPGRGTVVSIGLPAAEPDGAGEQGHA